MPAGVVKTPEDKRLWAAAKKAAKKGEYQGDALWKIATKIFKNMKNSGGK